LLYQYENIFLQVLELILLATCTSLDTVHVLDSYTLRIETYVIYKVGQKMTQLVFVRNSANLHQFCCFFAHGWPRW